MRSPRVQGRMGSRVFSLSSGLAALGLGAALAACGAGAKGPADLGGAGPSETRTAPDRPTLAVIAREGDPRGAVALAVGTAGLAPERGAEVAVALSAVVEARTRGAHLEVVPGWEGYRVRALVASAEEATAVTLTMRDALLAPVTSADLAAAQKKLASLVRRPMADARLIDVVRCTGEAFGRVGAPTPAPTLEELEGWRRAAHGTARVVFGAAGGSRLADAVAAALVSGPAWPTGEAKVSSPAVADGDLQIYDATGDVPPGASRVTLTARTARADRAVRAASALGDPQGALASRLGGLEAPARIVDVTATAQAGGGCLAVTLDFTARDLSVEAASRIASAAALTRQEVASELFEVPADDAFGAALARRAGDPRDAAELTAWWALSRGAPAWSLGADPSIAVAVGLANPRDAAPPPQTAPAAPAVPAKLAGLRGEIDRSVLAWHQGVVDARSRVERGQGEMWLLVGSPCGTLAEVEGDAGLGATFAFAAADRANLLLHDDGAAAEGWATPEGLGVLAHGPALPGEAPAAQARRLADAAARSFAAEPLDRAAAARARSLLVSRDERSDARALLALAEATTPGHPSWLSPSGAAATVGRAADAAIAGRGAALRSGPLRVAVLATEDDAQADAAVRAVDRWVARRPGATRTCVAPSAAAAGRPGTYAVDVSAGGASEAWLAFPVGGADPAAADAARWIAAALDGESGLLARALGSGLATSWSARVVGPPRAPLLVVRLGSVPGALDAAVAQTRALFDRLRQGSLTEADRTRAASVRAEGELASALDPRYRLAALFRGDPRDEATAKVPPSLEALRAFAAAALHEEALVIVAARPPRPRPAPPTPTPT